MVRRAEARRPIDRDPTVTDDYDRTVAEWPNTLLIDRRQQSFAGVAPDTAGTSATTIRVKLGVPSDAIAAALMRGSSRWKVHDVKN